MGKFFTLSLLSFLPLYNIHSLALIEINCNVILQNNTFLNPFNCFLPTSWQIRKSALKAQFKSHHVLKSALPPTFPTGSAQLSPCIKHSPLLQWLLGSFPFKSLAQNFISIDACLVYLRIASTQHRAWNTGGPQSMLLEWKWLEFLK